MMIRGPEYAELWQAWFEKRLPENLTEEQQRLIDKWDDDVESWKEEREGLIELADHGRVW